MFFYTQHIVIHILILLSFTVKNKMLLYNNPFTIYSLAAREALRYSMLKENVKVCPIGTGLSSIQT